MTIWSDFFKNEKMKPLVRVGLLALCALSFVLSGYYVTYTLFFKSSSIDAVSYETKGGKKTDFIYDGVSYFKGAKLNVGRSRTATFAVPPVVKGGEGYFVELFVRMDEYDSPGAKRRAPGALVVRQTGIEKPAVVELKPLVLQRVLVPWMPGDRDTSSFRITYRPGSDDSGKRVNQLLYSSRLRGVSFWGAAFFWFLLGVGALSCLRFAGGLRDRKVLVAIMVPIVVMYYFHSGGFISNDYFNGHHRVPHACYQLKTLLNTGCFSDTMYRGAGFILVPAMALALEGDFLILEDAFSTIFPSTRYIVFAWAALSLAYLLFVLYRRYGLTIPFLFGLLYATYYPILVDLYVLSADGYFIPLMSVFLGSVLCLVKDGKIVRKHLAVLCVVLFLMLSVKVTPIFLAFIVPFSLLFLWKELGGKGTLKITAVVFCCLFVAMVFGKASSNLFQHPERNVGIPGEPYQDSVFWEILWASSGYFDNDTAHKFTCAGSLRSKRVWEVTGMEHNNLARHSQKASEQLYRPGSINALKEQPGHFYTTSLIKLYRYGLASFGYGEGRGRFRLIMDHKLKKLVKLDRFDKGWKIAPLAMLSVLYELDLQRPHEIVLIMLSLLGIFMLRDPSLVAFLYAMIAFRFGFETLLHALSRYFMFTNIAILLGMAVFLTFFLSKIREYNVPRLDIPTYGRDGGSR